MKKYYLVIAFIVCASGVFAQKEYDRSDFERITAAYAKLTQLQTDMDYVYYPSHNSRKPGETLHATLWLKGSSYLYRLGGVETLSNPTLTIMADHEEKLLLVDSTRRSVRQVLFGADLDALLSVCSNIRSSNPEPGVKKYELYADLAETERIDIYFDTKTFLMRRVVLFYNTPLSIEEGGTGEKPRLELVYRLQNPRPNFTKDFFSTERLVQKSGRRFVPAPAMRGYQIMDNLSK